MTERAERKTSCIYSSLISTKNIRNTRTKVLSYYDWLIKNLISKYQAMSYQFCLMEAY